MHLFIPIPCISRYRWREIIQSKPPSHRHAIDSLSQSVPFMPTQLPPVAEPRAIADALGLVGDAPGNKSGIIASRRSVACVRVTLDDAGVLDFHWRAKGHFILFSEYFLLVYLIVWFVLLYVYFFRFLWKRKGAKMDFWRFWDRLIWYIDYNDLRSPSLMLDIVIVILY